MKTFLAACFMALLPALANAQAEFIVKGDCTPVFTTDAATGTTAAARQRRLPAVKNTWDPTRTYRQAVILVSFADTDFNTDDPHTLYDNMFNLHGFNSRDGAGCVADYFRDQSGGMFNVQFDVYGPIKVSSNAQPYSNPNEDTRNFGHDVFVEATKKAIDSLHIDFTPYDWNHTGRVNQVIFVYAGLTGNQSSSKCYGHIWPNTSTISTITTNGIRISDYSASAEQWYNGASCGIGTILHEYSHSLGLPDIYPTASSAGYSIMDEWDLMDGGNFTNYGWCPPNYTPMEKFLLGWLTPVDLSQPQTINNLKPASEGGEVYRIKHTDSEWLFLENRQQTGWDLGTPGKGLLIYHVYYDRTRWAGNIVNNDKSKRGYNLVAADNMDYDQWYDYLMTWEMPKLYANSNHMNSHIFSTSPYPWVIDSMQFVNDRLTDVSTPPARMNYANAKGSTLLSKSVTNIVQNEDGTVSFDFMNDAPKCATPTITYEKGRIYFDCETEGATFVSKVTSAGSTESEGADVALVTQYTITVYAVLDGYINSDTVTATLRCDAGKMSGENISIIDTTYKTGDVNEDGTVDVADISSVITIMANDIQE